MPMLDTAHIHFDRRHAFYLDATGDIHPLCASRLDRRHRGEPDTTLPRMAGHVVRFALFHVERFTSPPRIVLEHYPMLPLDAHGRLDPRLHYAALQAEVDRLEATDYAVLESPVPADPATTWIPDPVTQRRLLAALRDLRRPAWRPAPPRHRQSAA